MVDWPGRQSRGKQSSEDMRQRQQDKAAQKRVFNRSVTQHQRSETRYNVGAATARVADAAAYNENASVFDYNKQTGYIELTDRSAQAHHNLWKNRRVQLLTRSNPFAIPTNINRETSKTRRIINDSKEVDRS